MIITNEALKHFINIDLVTKDELIKVLNSAGLEVEGFSKMVVPNNVVVAKIIKKIQHPNADKLNLCDVDAGDFGIFQIVCGAKNVYSGMYVALALNGAVLPNNVVINETTIRGIVSYGMLCSSVELGLPVLNDGILELDESIGELILGKEIREYNVFNQEIYDLNLTPNRGDCLCVLGVAREIAYVFNLIIKQINLLDSGNSLGIGRYLQIFSNGNLKSSLVYKIVEFKKIYTPLDIMLTLGICNVYHNDPILNFAEYASYMTGAIFNVYPLDDKKICINNMTKLVIQRDENDLECVFSSINEGENTILHKLSIIGASTHKPISIGYPRSFIFEASFIDSFEISSRVYKKDKSLFDASILYKSMRGSSKELEDSMNFLCNSLSNLDVNIYSGIQEMTRTEKPINISVTFSFISNCIGNHISKENITMILKKLGFKVQAANDENFFIVEPPSFRNDIKNPNDVTEEVLRVYGIDNVCSIPFKLNQMSQITSTYNKHMAIKNIRNRSLSNGFFECIHYLFDNSKILTKLGFKNLDKDKKLVNPITSELDTLRQSLIPHILESMQRNKNLGYESMKFFEIGYVYDEFRNPILKFALAICGDLVGPNYPNPKGIQLDFYSFANLVSNVIGKFSCKNLDSIPNKIIHPFQSGNIVKSKEIGIISKANPLILNMYNLDSVFFAELNLDDLLKESEFLSENKKINSFSNFQINKRDLTILIDKNIPFNDIRNLIFLKNIENVINMFPIDIYDENDSLNALTIRLFIQSKHKTLNENEIKDSVNKILYELESNFDARLKA